MKELYNVLNNPEHMEQLRQAGYNRHQIEEIMATFKADAENSSADFTFRGKLKPKQEE